MLKSSPVAWAVQAEKVVLVVKAVLVADDLPLADDLVVLMLRVEIRKALARDDLQLNS